ncbi:MAG: AMP-binding protein [Xanthobacteraceae bacterium]|nr:AMP-binding protein [Xanthobacteraceae bacterium]
MGEVIRLNAINDPDHVALVTQNRKPLRYGELERHIVAITSHLRGAGLSGDARVAIALPHGLEAVLAIAAVACGAVAVPIDPRLTAVEIGECLARLKIAAVILPPGESPAREAAAARDISVFTLSVSPDGALEVETPRPRRPAPPPGQPRLNALAYILATSGTTGGQKFVPYSHRNQIALSARARQCLGLDVQDRCLCLSPAFYSYGLSLGILTPLLTGGSIALPGHPANPDLSRWLADLNPTWCVGGAVIYRAISEQAARGPVRAGAHRLRFLVSAGMALADDVRIAMELAAGVPVLEHYGLTEAGMMVTNRLEPHLRRPGTCGKASAGTVAIVGPDGRPLPPGEIGEILVSGPTLTSGYLDDAEANAASFVDGWFRTGDLGSLDADRFLTIRGRAKEAINRGGEKIMPAEIDAALMRHPAIAEAAAFGLPHPRSGEQVAAAVVVRQGTTVTAPELREWLGGRLARHKIPRRFVFVDSLPRALAGKVLRHELGRLAAGQLHTSPAAADARHGDAVTESELAELWAELLVRDEPIGVDEDFFAIGGDSVLAADMLLELERVTGVPLSDGILYQAPTIRDLARQLGTFAWSERRPLITVQPAGDQPPLFYCHGDYVGGGYYTRRFARLLGPEQPFHALPPPLLADGDALPSMEQQAAERVPLLLAKQPDGPFRLGGYCNGALLAFEMACQLEAAGREVELVVMIDPPSFNARRLFRRSCRAFSGVLRYAGLETARRKRVMTAFSARLASLASSAEQFVRAARPDRVAMLARLLARIRNRLRPDREQGSATRDAGHRFEARPAMFRGQQPPDHVLDRRWHRVVASYRPFGLRARVLIFAAAHSADPWRYLCDVMEIVDLPPDHADCITGQLERVAGIVRVRLANTGKQGGLRPQALHPAPLPSHA